VAFTLAGLEKAVVVYTGYGPMMKKAGLKKLKIFGKNSEGKQMLRFTNGHLIILEPLQ